MKICVISDLHGYLPDKTIVADMLLIGGDICPVWNHHITFEVEWLEDVFKKWLKKQKVKHVIFTPGNHDIIWESRPHVLPQLDFNCLIDEEIEVEGLRIYGSPWQPYFNNWAFNLFEDELSLKWDLIPDNIDILLLHGPPHGIMDSVKKGPLIEHTGSKSLRKKIFDIKPKLVIFGHIHSHYGIVEEKGIKFISGCLLNEEYKLVNKPIYIEV